MKTLILFLSILLSTSLHAASAYKYSDSKGAAYEGYLSTPKHLGVKVKQVPAVLIVHDWMGPSVFTREKADKLAKEGWIAMAVDVYGEGVRPKNQGEAAKLAGKFKGDRELLQARMKAAYDTLLRTPEVDPKKIVVMGYCFGGTAALELARSGVKLAGVVSFHGGLSNPHPESAKKIQGNVLVLHGADDPFVSPKEMEDFKNEMAAADRSAMIVMYPGAVHGFTNPKAGTDPKKGMAYQAKADHDSWEQLMLFLKGIENR